MAKTRKKGRFIVFEGIDGSGKTTQIEKLKKYFKEKDLDVVNIDYPDRKGPIGKLINSYLYKKYNFSKEVQFLLYFSDFVKDKKSINEWIEDGKTVIADRYFSSTLAYQCSDGFPVKDAVLISEIFKIPTPDLIVYLSISAETSLARKSKEKRGKLDRHEEDKKFLMRLAHMYEFLAEEKIFAPWVKINGEQSKEKIFSDITKATDISSAYQP